MTIAYNLHENNLTLFYLVFKVAYT